MTPRLRNSPVCLVLLLSCSGQPAPGYPTDDTAADGGAGDGGAGAPEWTAGVLVTLDGEPVAGVPLYQGGVGQVGTTGDDGTATVTLDATLFGDITLMASHPDARIIGETLKNPPDATVELALERFDASDNAAYDFQDPGEPERRDTTNQCGHCHVTIVTDWFASAHRAAASNPVVHDLYAGAAAAWSDEDACAEAGGAWWTGLGPGTGESAERCYLGDGVLPALNEGCGEVSACDGVAIDFGQCADCHAPGIDGTLGGRDLLDATLFAYDYGVHCDVCHKVESVDLEADPGVAGRLHLVRPSEDSPSPALGTFAPLTFGPSPDVVNPRMGSVQRDLFHEPELCAGCHQLDQPVLVPGVLADPDRWPEGRIPVHSTWAEWQAGPMNPGAPCQSCHMPPDATVGNGADLGNIITAVDPGVAAGWLRPVGSVRRHAWFGPRSDEQRMLDLAATLSLSASIADGELVVAATVKNVGPGHALPTGEPLRALMVLVDATCGDEPLVATGGDAVSDVGAYRDRKELGDDWTSWPGAEAGQRIAVVARTGAWWDYEGPGPFGDGTFSAEEKGLPEDLVAGVSTILSVDGDGAVTLDAVLPDGDVAYLVDAAGLPADGETMHAVAGTPGFAFARVHLGADGRRQVPHFLAVDVASDNRLLPQQEWTSEHRFAATCDDPVSEAVLVYRRLPLALVEERGWEVTDAVIASARVQP